MHDLRKQRVRYTPPCKLPRLACTHASTYGEGRLHVLMKQIDGTSSYADRHRQSPTTSTTDHVDHVSSGSAKLRPRRPRPEQLRRASTTSTTRLRRNDDRREERRYDNRDHSHEDRSKSSRTGQLHRQRHVKPSLEHRNTPTTPTGRQ